MLREKKLSVIAISMMLSGAVAACPLHFGAEQGELDLPGASQLLINSIFLEKSDDLQALKPLPPAATFQRASWWLRIFAKSLHEHHIEDLHIVLADIPLWSHLLPSPSPIRIDVEKPEPTAKVVMLTQVGLQALITRSISMQQALSLGLVRLHQVDDETRSKLEQLAI